VIGPERAALAIVMLLDGMTVPTQPAALRAIFRCRIRCALAAAVSAGLMDEANGDECAAALTEGAAQ
jgi:hypothetical protein